MPERAADVSVIIPAYRAAGTIERALLSVAAQTLAPREVVVVDDGSDDDTIEAAEACRTGLGAIALKVVRQSNRGAGAARNRAIMESAGGVLAFLDADDVWLPDKLARSMFYLDQGYVLVAHNGWIVETGREPTLNDCASRFRDSRDPFVALYKKGFLDTCTVVVRREAVVAAGGFDESLPNAQDFELWLAMLRAPGARFLVFGETLAAYHIMPGSIMSHVERRLACCHEVACRYAADMRSRRDGGWRAVAFRELAIHYEAVAALSRRRRYVLAGLLLLGAPSRVVAALAALRAPATPREPLACR